MHAVARLIRRVMVRESWSMREIVRRATRAGHEVSNSRMSQIMREDIKLFGHDNVAVLVDALNEPPEAVLRAYIEAIGFELPANPKFTIENAIRLDERLTVDDKAHLNALLRSMLRRAKAREKEAADSRELDLEDLDAELTTGDNKPHNL